MVEKIGQRDEIEIAIAIWRFSGGISVLLYHTALEAGGYIYYTGHARFQERRKGVYIRNNISALSWSQCVGENLTHLRIF